MLSFEPKKYHLQELLIYFVNLKKSEAEAQKMKRSLDSISVCCQKGERKKVVISEGSLKH